MFLLTLSCQAEPSKVMSLNFDDTANVVYINLMESTQNTERELKFSKLENPNRIYFDIDNSVLIGDKQHLVFEKSNIKEIRLSQFTINPDVVRGVITFEEGFDTTKVKLIYTNGNIIVKCANLFYSSGRDSRARRGKGLGGLQSGRVAGIMRLAKTNC